MAIDVYCNCGNALSVSTDLAGRKIRCKKCKEVLEIPKVGLNESIEAPAPDDYEVVSEETETRSCPSCGANASSEDTACLACGADLSQGSFGFLDKVPTPVLMGGAILVLLGILYGVGSFVYNAWRPGRHVASGRAALNAEDWATATTEFKAALTFDNKHPEAIEGLALVGAKKPDPGLLKRHARAAVKTLDDPLQRAEIRLAYGWVLLEGGDADAAHNQAIDAKADDSKVPGLHDLLGLAALKNPDKALEHLQKAAAAASKRPEVYRNLAEIYRAKKKFTKGRTAAESLIKHSPEDPKAWLLVGSLRLETKDRVGYVQALNKAAELDPKNPDAYSRLSKVYLEDGKLKDALASAEKAASLAPKNAEAHISVGRILLAFDRPVAAREALERALKLEKKNWEALFLLGKAQLLTKKPREGLAKIKTALRDRKKDLPLHLEAGRAAIKGGQPREAVNLLQGQIRYHANDYDLRIVLAEALSKEDRGEQRHKSAIEEHLRHALTCDTERTEAPLALGRFLYGQLRNEEALTVLDKALKNNAQHPGLLYTKGRVCHRLKSYDAAIEALEAAGDYQDAKTILRQVKDDKYYNESGED